MLEKTALFIHLFKSRNLDNLLKEQFIEQIGMIESLGTLILDKESEFQLSYIFEKDIPNFLNSYMNAETLSLNTMQENLSKQAQHIKDSLLSIYVKSSNEIINDMNLQLKILANRNQKIQASMGTTKTIENKDLFLEQVEDEISLEHYKTFKEQGEKLLAEDVKSASWQNGFSSTSDLIIKDKSTITKPQENNTFSQFHFVVLIALFSIIVSFSLIFF